MADFNITGMVENDEDVSDVHSLRGEVKRGLADVVSADYTVVSDEKDLVEEEGDVVYGYREGVKSMVFTPDWSWLANSETDKKAISDVFWAFLTLIALAVAVVSTYTEQELLFQVNLYSVVVVLFVWSDPINCFGRFLASQSRILISVALLFTNIGLIANSKSLWKVVAIADVIIACIVRFANTKWLKNEMWKMTKACERAMEHDEKNISSKAWQGTGKREARSILHELGISVTEEDLDYVVRSIYVLGHIHGYGYTERKNLDVDKLNKKIQALEIDVATYKEKAEGNDSLNETVKKKNSEIESLKREIEKANGLLTAATLKAKQLESANEELTSDLGKALGEETEADKEQKQFMFEMATLGILSLKSKTSDNNIAERPCADILGVPRSQVQKVKRKYASGYLEVEETEEVKEGDETE